MSDNTAAKWAALQRWLRRERRAYRHMETCAQSEVARWQCQRGIAVVEATLDEMRRLSQRKASR